jgi:hypothetical protein
MIQPMHSGPLLLELEAELARVDVILLFGAIAADREKL